MAGPYLPIPVETLGLEVYRPRRRNGTMTDMDEKNGGKPGKDASGEVAPRATRRTFTRAYRLARPQAPLHRGGEGHAEGAARERAPAQEARADGGAPGPSKKTLAMLETLELKEGHER